MKAITVKPPWSWAILHGGKHVENRSRLITHRGLLLIHAGATWSVRGQSDSRVRAAWRAHHGATGKVPPLTSGSGPGTAASASVEVGAIVGLVNVVGCHRATPGDDGAMCCQPWGDDLYRGQPVYHLMLTDILAFEIPIPCRGYLGLWTPAPPILATIAHHLAGTTC